ncbi:MIF4G domain-containing protein, partial [Cardiosporidium cionae]
PLESPSSSLRPFSAKRTPLEIEKQKYSIFWLLVFGHYYENSPQRIKSGNLPQFLLKSKSIEEMPAPEGGALRRSHAYLGSDEEKRLRGLPSMAASAASSFPIVSLPSTTLSAPLANHLLPLSRLPPQMSNRGLLSSSGTPSCLTGATLSGGLAPLRRDHWGGGGASSNLSTAFVRGGMGGAAAINSFLIRGGAIVSPQEEGRAHADWRSRRDGGVIPTAQEAAAADDRFAEAIEQWRHTSPEDSRIKPSENSWSELQKQQKCMESVTVCSDETAMKLRRFRSILNKLTFEKFDSLYAQLLSLRISTVAEIDGLMRMIFDLAVTQHHFITMYSNLCLRLNLDLPLFDDKKYFKRTLLNHCNYSFDENLKPMERNDDLTPQEAFEKEVLYKKRMNGNVKFVGELLIRKIVSSKIICECIDALLEGRQKCVKNSNGKDQGVHHLEALSAFLNAIGNQFTSKQFSHYCEIVNRFAAIKILLNNKDIPLRERLLLKNVIEDYENGWIRKVAASQKGPMKLSDVQRLMNAESHNSASLPNFSRAYSSTPSYYSHDTHHTSGYSSMNHNTNSDAMYSHNKNLSPLLKQSSFDSLQRSSLTLPHGSLSFGNSSSIKRSPSPLFIETAKIFLKDLENIADQIEAEEDVHSAITRIEGFNIPKEFHGQIWWRLSVNICKTFCESKSLALLFRWLVLLLEKQTFDSLACQKEFLRCTSEDKASKTSSIGYQRNCDEIKGYSEKLKILLEQLHKNTKLPEEWQSSLVQNILKKLLL